MSIFTLAADFYRTHSGLIAFLFWLFLAIYSTETKNFLHRWPRTRAAYRSYVKSNAETELTNLARYHNNAYALTLLVSRRTFALILIALAAAALYVSFLTFEVPGIIWRMLSQILLGFFFGTLVNILMFLKRLSRYDESVARLRKIVDES